jgi:hypothetical protein
MMDVETWRTVVALWTLIAAVAVITCLALTGPLMPADARDALSLLALGLVALAHALSLGALLFRRVRPTAPGVLGLAGGQV